MALLSSSSDLSTEEPLLSHHRTCIKVSLLGDIEEAIVPITMDLECNDEDIASIRCRVFSDLIEILGKGFRVENIGGTRLNIEIPSILSKYIFIALPFCHHTSTQFIYTVRVDNSDCVVPASQVMSLLKDIESPNVTQTLDERVRYELTVHRYGDLTLFDTIHCGEYTCGTFLYLMTGSDDIDSDDEWRQEAIVRDGPNLFYPDNISRPATGVVPGKDFPEYTQSKIVTTTIITSDPSDVIHERPLTQEIPPLLVEESTTFQIEESRSQDGEQVIVGSAVKQLEGQLVLPSYHFNKGAKNLLTKSTVQLSDQFTKDQLSVHALHHVYNHDKPCQYTENECRNMLGSKEFTDYCVRVKTGQQCDNLSDQDTDWLKCTIRFHCESCCDETCCVPHLFAGCPPPTVFSLSNGSSITDDNTSSSSSNSSSSQDSGSIQTPQPTQPLVPSQTTLSPPRVSPSYQYPSPVATTGEGGASLEYIIRPLPQQDIFHQPSIAPRQSIAPPKSNILERLDARKKTGHGQQQILPENLANKKHGDILYDPEGFLKSIFPSGKMAALPKCSELTKYDRIGKGGNGIVIKFPIEGEYYALKYTSYRKMENLLWSSLCHENILLLLGTVAICPDPPRCCQVMSLMTVSLRDELRDIGGSILDGLARRIPEAVLHINVRHIIRCILQGLDYLFQQHLHHRDLKERNILVYKTCRCPNVLQCLCHEKACIQIADFDSILLVKTAFPGAFTGYNDYPVTPKSPEKCAKVLGTPGNRAPEQFMEIAPAIIPNDTKVNIAGPWSDIWSFGVLVINMSYGSNQRHLTKEASILCFQPYRTKLDKNYPQVELVLTELKLKELFKEDNMLIRRIARLVDKCIQADFRNRSTPEELLQDEFFLKCR